MKEQHHINKWSFTIIVVLHVLVWASEFNLIDHSYGRSLAMFTLIGQAFLGIIQLSIAIPMLTSIKKYSLSVKKLIRTYWVMVILYMVISGVFIANTFDVFEPFVLFTPLGLACYFVWVTYQASLTHEIPNSKSENIS